MKWRQAICQKKNSEYHYKDVQFSGTEIHNMYKNQEEINNDMALIETKWEVSTVE